MKMYTEVQKPHFSIQLLSWHDLMFNTKTFNDNMKQYLLNDTFLNKKKYCNYDFSFPVLSIESSSG